MVEHQPSKLDTWVRFPSPALVQGYRSGHNEAVLKTVCPQGRVGSNPTLSANCTAEPERWVPGAELNMSLVETRCESTNAEVPKWLKGLPWKGSRSLVAARGFKSLLLRFNLWRKKLLQKKLKKFLTNRKRYDRMNELLLKNREQQKQSSLKTEQYVKPWKFL